MPNHDAGWADFTSNSYTTQVDVLIVGLGPVGATLGALLGQAGIEVLVVEPARDVYPLPRAAHIDHEIMRIFQSLGLSQRIAPFLRAAPNYEFRSSNGTPFMLIEREGVTGSSGWPSSFNIYQPGIERELRSLIGTLHTVKIAFGARFDGLVQTGEDKVVTRILVDGEPSIVRSRFVVGCDGAWSPVRENLGIKLFDYAFDEPWLVLDTCVADESRFPTSNLQICDPGRPTTFVHMSPGRLRWEFMLKPGEDAAAMQRPESVRKLLEPWFALGAIAVERSAVYRFHGLVAHQWRSGRVFLAGDAAHQMPPFMGQGMCSGLRDAANLAWKIERALRSGPSEALLDSYQREREPHVRAIITKAIEMGRLVCTIDPELAARRDEQMLAAPRVGKPEKPSALLDGWLLPGSRCAGEFFPQPVARAQVPLFLDDVLGRKAWLILRSRDRPKSFECESICVVSATDLPPSLAAPTLEWLNHNNADAALIRPDRYVFGTGDPQQLIDAYLGQDLLRTAAHRIPHGIAVSSRPDEQVAVGGIE